eukprot:Gregarina_sp_Poly_1__591@NODE_113_length_13886_cov_267_363051_g100_i0_p4_GENE_NODE_113_length_13886_cov_267_363051_g100_i0NODE_113_length_13886_cov_267_363051_g100_i0_p4_ORF_typecomplete_len448_score35_53Glyco_transf_34/PF05637_12/0_00045_NODE_113_length_13886_cov_267_363051_g100_i0301373
MSMCAIFLKMLILRITALLIFAGGIRSSLALGQANVSDHYSSSQQARNLQERNGPFREMIYKYRNLPVVALHVPGAAVNTTLSSDFFTRPVTCDSIVYTAHSLHRPIEEELDLYRIGWSMSQYNNCFFLFLLDLANDTQIVTKPIRDAWKRRGSPHDPRILTLRYKAGLFLMALVKVKKIRTSTNQAPWILYVDGDTMLANTRKSIHSIVERVDRGTAVPTIEQRLCARSREISCSDSYGPAAGVNEYALVTSVSNNCHQGYYTHSGAFLFQASRATGFLFHVLAESPSFEIDAGKFKMGDQGIWDWVLQNTFGMNWTRLRSLCSPAMRSLTRTACEYSDILFSRPLTLAPSRLQPHLLLQEAQEKWFPVHQPVQFNEPLSVALVCVKWFNAPGCPFPMLKDPMHAFQCGDMLWHLYGCKKEEWKKGPLHKALTSEYCDGLIPEAVH